MFRSGTPRRRAASVVLGLVLALPIVSSQASAVAAPPVLPTSGALFGAFVQVNAHTGPDRRTALENFETLVGRKMAIERVYYLWNQSWPTADDAWTRDAGRIPYISWNAKRTDGSVASWSDIASGVYDPAILARAADLITFGGPVIFSFHHEPEEGVPAEFIAAYRHIHDLFETAGVSNVSYAWTMTARSFRNGKAAPFYPGDDVVDVIASDGYNWYTCPGRPHDPWRPFTSIFGAFHAFGEQHGKQMIIAEWGGREDPALPGRKATWIDEASTQLKLWPDIAAVLYYNADKGCARWVDTSASSLASFRAMGADPYFNPPPTISITSGPDVSTARRTATLAFTAPGAAGYRCSIDGAAATPCNDGTWTRTNISAGSHVFEVFAVDGGGSPTTAPTRWSWTVVPSGTIDVRDVLFSPASRTVGQDTGVLFRFHGPSSHTVTDTSGMELFDSGPMPAGTTETVPVVGAGGYPFACSIHPSMTGRLNVGVLTSPGSGTTSTVFSVRWAAGPEDGFVFDVQVKRPGTTLWKVLLTDTPSGSVSFTPDRGAGTYSFRARTQRVGEASTQWSVAKTINVS
jgi:plastocyanin